MYHIVKQTTLGDITSIASSFNRSELMDSLTGILGKNFTEAPGNVFINTDTHAKYKIVEEFEYLMLLKRTDVVL